MKRTVCRVARGGFTLIEAAVATVVVGIGVTVLLISVNANTRANSAGKHLTEAVFLAQEIREWTLRLPFSDTDEGDMHNPPGPDGMDPQDFVDDLDDLLDVTYSPPRDGQGYPLADMVNWSEAIQLTWRDPDNLIQEVPPGASDVIHVEVELSNRSGPVLTTGWLVTRRE